MLFRSARQWTKVEDGEFYGAGCVLRWGWVIGGRIEGMGGRMRGREDGLWTR